jgi:hypothetical protein
MAVVQCDWGRFLTDFCYCDRIGSPNELFYTTQVEPHFGEGGCYER